ncbi:MAG: hypothetical protein ACP5OG_00710 [Candidatus Nanoarchaeia archaeon]
MPKREPEFVSKRVRLNNRELEKIVFERPCKISREILKETDSPFLSSPLLSENSKEYQKLAVFYTKRYFHANYVN